MNLSTIHTKKPPKSPKSITYLNVFFSEIERNELVRHLITVFLLRCFRDVFFFFFIRFSIVIVFAYAFFGGFFWVFFFFFFFLFVCFVVFFVFFFFF